MDAGLVEHLRSAGYGVSYIPETRAGADDIQVLRRAQRENRLLLTEDKDFGELVFHGSQPVPGLVLLRIAPEQHDLKRARLEAAIRHFAQRLFGRYVVVEPSRFRSRLLRPDERS